MFDTFDFDQPAVIMLVGGPRDGDLVGVPEPPHTYRMAGMAMSLPEMMQTLAPPDSVPVVEWRYRPRRIRTPDGNVVLARNPEGALYYDVQPQ